MLTRKVIATNLLLSADLKLVPTLPVLICLQDLF